MQQVREVIDTIEAVSGVEERPSQMSDCVTVSVRTKDNADIREELSMKLYERKLPIMGMNLQEHSLEDIFLELTERQEEDAKTEKEEEDEHDSDI